MGTRGPEKQIATKA